MPGTTPIFGFTYPYGNEPAKSLATAFRSSFERLEAVLKNRAAVPGLENLNAVVARLQALELLMADTGQKPVQPYLAAGWSPGGDGATFRVKGGVATLSTHLVRTSGGTAAAGSIIMTLPATLPVLLPDGRTVNVNCRPAQMGWPVGLKFGAATGEYKIQPTGVVSMGLAIEQGSGLVATTAWHTVAPS